MIVVTIRMEIVVLMRLIWDLISRLIPEIVVLLRLRLDLIGGIIRIGRVRFI